MQTRQRNQPIYNADVTDSGRLLVAVGSKKKATFNNPELYEQLRLLRNRFAKELQVPAYVVFTDKSLKEMSTYLPVSRAELLEIQGVGQAKCQYNFHNFHNTALPSLQNSSAYIYGNRTSYDNKTPSF